MAEPSSSVPPAATLPRLLESPEPPDAAPKVTRVASSPVPPPTKSTSPTPPARHRKTALPRAADLAALTEDPGPDPRMLAKEREENARLVKNSAALQAAKGFDVTACSWLNVPKVVQDGLFGAYQRVEVAMEELSKHKMELERMDKQLRHLTDRFGAQIEGLKEAILEVSRKGQGSRRTRHHSRDDDKLSVLLAANGDRRPLLRNAVQAVLGDRKSTSGPAKPGDKMRNVVSALGPASKSPTGTMKDIAVGQTERSARFARFSAADVAKDSDQSSATDSDKDIAAATVHSGIGIGREWMESVEQSAQSLEKIVTDVRRDLDAVKEQVSTIQAHTGKAAIRMSNIWDRVQQELSDEKLKQMAAEASFLALQGSLAPLLEETEEERQRVINRLESVDLQLVRVWAAVEARTEPVAADGLSKRPKNRKSTFTSLSPTASTDSPMARLRLRRSFTQLNGSAACPRAAENDATHPPQISAGAPPISSASVSPSPEDQEVSWVCGELRVESVLGMAPGCESQTLTIRTTPAMPMEDMQSQVPESMPIVTALAVPSADKPLFCDSTTSSSKGSVKVRETGMGSEMVMKRCMEAAREAAEGFKVRPPSIITQESPDDGEDTSDTFEPFHSLQRPSMYPAPGRRGSLAPRSTGTSPRPGSPRPNSSTPNSARGASFLNSQMSTAGSGQMKRMQAMSGRFDELSAALTELQAVTSAQDARIAGCEAYNGSDTMLGKSLEDFHNDLVGAREAALDGLRNLENRYETMLRNLGDGLSNKVEGMAAKTIKELTTAVDGCISNLDGEAAQIGERIKVIFPRAFAQASSAADFSVSEARIFALDSRINYLEKRLAANVLVEAARASDSRTSVARQSLFPAEDSNRLLDRKTATQSSQSRNRSILIQSLQNNSWHRPRASS